MPSCILCGTPLNEIECDSRQEWVDYSYNCPECGCDYSRRKTFKTQSDMIESDILYVEVPLNKRGRYISRNAHKITDYQRQRLLDHITECLIVENVCPVALDKAKEWMYINRGYKHKFFGSTVKQQKIMINANIDKLVGLYPDIFNGIDLSEYSELVISKICKTFRR